MRGQTRALGLLTLLCAACAIIAIAVLSAGSATAGEGSLDAMSIDMDPGAGPANTATSIGSREFCARLNENGKLDGDEDAFDTLEFDVTTGPLGIPASNPLLAFQAELLFDGFALAITSVDESMLLAADPGSEIFSASTWGPDDGRFVASALDISEPSALAHAESGPGVFVRLGVSSAQHAVSGLRDLLLGESFYAGPQGGVAILPDHVDHGIVALGVECPAVQPTPGPSPTPSPGPPSPTRGVPSTPPPSHGPSPSPSPGASAPTLTPGAVLGVAQGPVPGSLPQTGGPSGHDGTPAALTLATVGALAALAAGAVTFRRKSGRG